MKNLLWVYLTTCCIGLAFAAVSSPKRDSSLLTVNLGYEIHQATFNVRCDYY